VHRQTDELSESASFRGRTTRELYPMPPHIRYSPFIRMRDRTG